MIGDVLTIVSRLWWLLARTPWTPVPWARCHCGALAELREPVVVDGDVHVVDWCMPCKFAGHDTCGCSQDQDTP